MFTLSAPKPMKPVPTKEPKEQKEELPRPDSRSSRRSGSRSKEPSPSPANFLHAMTGGLIGSQSPTMARPDSGGSLFGSLLRRGRKGSRSGSQQGSRDSSGDRSSDIGEDGRGSSMGSEASYAGSENSLRMKLKKMRKKKPKVQPQDFDQLFARGLALSAQLESEQNKDPFGPKAVDLGRQMMEVGAATAAAGGDTDAISVGLSEGVSGATGVRIGYAEKVNAYLDDQAQSSGAKLDMGEAPKERERGRRRHRREPKTSESEHVVVQEEKRKTSREYTKPEDIQLSPVPKRDLFTGEMLIPGSPDAEFLAKVTAFVADNEKDAQWPAITSSQKPGSSSTKASALLSDMISGKPSSLTIPSQARLAPSPGKSFLDSTTGYEVFGPSVERDNPPQSSGVDSKPTGSDQITSTPSPTSISMSMFSAAAKDAVVKLTSPPPQSTSTLPPARMTVTSPPRPEEPGDKGIPNQLIPDKLMANEEFYDKLRSTLKTALTPERGFDTTQEDPGSSYQKYSHHLGRAEFGTLKKPSVMGSRDDSGDRIGAGRGVSRDTSGDRIPERMASSRKVSRQNSGTYSRDIRSDSRISDTSMALPDLEVDPTAVLDMVGAPVLRTMSDNVNDPPPVPHPSVASKDVLVRKEEVLKDMELHRQKIQEAKAWIQNGLMTVVGVGVMAYLQTLEQMGGAT